MISLSAKVIEMRPSIDDLVAAADASLDGSIKAAGMRVESEVSILAPVVGGTLRDSFRVQADGTVLSDVPYALAVNRAFARNGRKPTALRPVRPVSGPARSIRGIGFIDRGLENAHAKLLDEIHAVVERELGQGG